MHLPLLPGASRFRAAVEAERWRSRLGGTSSATVDKDKDKLDSYRQPEQAGWVRERLLGTQVTEDDDEDDEVVTRARKAVAQAWLASSSSFVDVAAVDRLEEMMRRRLGELESTSAHAGRAARSFFADCDPQRTGRLRLDSFIDCMGRKLNYDFPARGTAHDSRSVLEALFRRLDLDRAGVMMAEDFHAALVGASRDGRANGRVVNAIGRLREGIARCAGGYDQLLRSSHWWAARQKEAKAPEGCVPCSTFVEGLQKLAELAAVRLTEADLVTVCETFEPPPAACTRAADESDPFVSFDQFVLATRGPPMGTGRLGLVKAAYAALKDDAKSAKVVKPEHLAARYDLSHHPAVVGGALEEKEAAMALLGVWMDALDKEVPKGEFCDRYEWISALYDDDSAFDQMMRTAWNLK
jgi:hypothetical protein